MRVMTHESMPIPVILTRQEISGGWSGQNSVNVPNGGSVRPGSMACSVRSGLSLYSAISGMSGRSSSCGNGGWGKRFSPVIPKQELCDRPGHCDLHPRSFTHSSPLLTPTVVRVRGVPPSRFIPRPFAPGVSRGFETYVPSASNTHAALTDMLSNVKMVFDTLEICFIELDAWRAYFGSGP